METVLCNLCGSDEQKLLWKGQDWAFGNSTQFTMVRCMKCGLIFLNPRPAPDEMESYYPKDYEPYRRTVRSLHSQLVKIIHRFKLRPRVRIIKQFRKTGRLLDVGCAAGEFIHELRRTSNWKVQGVEVNARMARIARRQLDLDVFCGRLSEAKFQNSSFDVVTMWDVLEHLYNPLATLVEVQRILKPGGLFIGSVPNGESLDARIFGRYWAGLDFPRHLYVFSSSTLTSLLKKARLEPEQFFCFYGRYTTFALSISLWLNAHTHNRTWKKYLRSILFFPLFRYLTLPYFLIVDAFKLGSVITVRARKPIDTGFNHHACNSTDLEI